MARRPKRINLEAISDSTHKDHKKHVMALVEDLLRKYPRGPECTLTAKDYHNDWTGHPTLSSSDRESGVNCGYSDLTLYRFCTAMQVDGTEWDFKFKVRNWYHDLGKNGVTRRSRRLSHRVEGAYRRTRRAGRPGLYEVTFSDPDHYSNRHRMFVHAENSEMAVMVAKCSVGPAFPSHECAANFEEEGCPSTLMGKNAKMVRDIELKIVAAHETIKKMKKDIEIFELRAAMVQTYSISAVGT